MKWKKVENAITQAENDIGGATELKPSYRWGEEKALEENLDQWTIDQMYDLLGTGIINAKAAIDILRPHTTYFKKETPANMNCVDIRIHLRKDLSQAEVSTIILNILEHIARERVHWIDEKIIDSYDQIEPVVILTPGNQELAEDINARLREGYLFGENTEDE